MLPEQKLRGGIKSSFLQRLESLAYPSANVCFVKENKGTAHRAEQQQQVVRALGKSLLTQHGADANGLRLRGSP